MHKLLVDSPGKKTLLLGNEAIVRGAIEAGVAFATCYPGTPSSEIGDSFFQISRECDLYYEYSINEKVALDMAAAASIAGVRSMCSMKHVGLNVAADTLMTLAYLGVNGGLVIVTADDPGMFSGINEQDNRYYGKLSSLSVLEPSFSQDAKDLARYAFELSEELREPVILRSTTRVSHSSGLVTFGELRKRETGGHFEKAPSKWVPLPAFSGGMHKKLLESLEKARTISNQSAFNQRYGQGEWGIITSGISFNYVMDAIRDLGIQDQCSVLKLGHSYPLPDEKILDLLSSCNKILVVEELEPFIEEAVKVLAQEAGINISIRGKGGDLFPRVSEFNPALVRRTIAGYFQVEYRSKTPIDTSDVTGLPPRPPNLCPGCPHRATYVAVRQVIGDGAIYSSDIGCYALGFFPPLRMADLTISMGSSIATGSSLAKTTGKKAVAFIGDSTFFHAGIPPLINAVFNRHNLTVIILDNGTTAMTGLQPSPAGDLSRLGLNNPQLSIEAIVKGMGVTDVKTVNPRNLKATMKAVRESLNSEGVSVIISRDLCVLYAGQVRKKKKTGTFVVDHSKCKDHRNCVNLVGCPSMFIESGQVQINSETCTKCSICAQVCPEGAIIPTKEAEEVSL